MVSLPIRVPSYKEYRMRQALDIQRVQVLSYNAIAKTIALVACSLSHNAQDITDNLRSHPWVGPRTHKYPI